MKILKVVFETVNIQEMKKFYTETLEMPIVKEKQSFFTVRAGKTLVTFQQTDSAEAPLYHFALKTSLSFYDYMFEKLSDLKVNILPNSNGELSGYWEGKQVYFTDPDGNIVEILEREISNDQSGWVDVCEVGIPSASVTEFSNFLSPIKNVYQTESDTFSFYGDNLGSLVLVKEGRHWYPTNRPATIHPIVVEVEGDQYQELKHPVLPITVKL
ncbi:VOC family protein [Paenisporosarcina sp. NPDC076898]|uniref:VOC family protein n=1 Tax=unclassified Paenisporosarcina TaxID=2642018 RepID=UPI003D05C66C